MAINILVVEDHVGLAEAMCGLLSDKGHNVKPLAFARHAIEELRENKYDLVFMDNNYSKGEPTGLEAIAQIREFDDSTPIYLTSAKKISSEKIDACGATGYISKNFIFDDEISKIAGKHSLMKEYYERTLKVKEIILGRSDLIERIKSTFIGENKVLLANKEGSCNRSVYKIGKINFGGRELYIAMKRFREYPLYDYKRTGFDSAKIKEWEHSVFTAEPYYHEFFTSDGRYIVPCFYLNANYKGELATITEDLTLGGKRYIYPTPEAVTTISEGGDEKWYLVDAKHFMRKDRTYPGGLKYLRDEARLDIV
ncbi:MAG: response regulator [Candidatus Nanoarchaeia archaeon]|nr:response regulator [Candidatus Nanoarchaeia archaeon]MDD5741534.1 response regulator [Candidatus Nanoarchaeia archaeon]